MTRRTKKAWTKWRELISEQVRSGQTVTAFCRERGLCRPYFFPWKKRLREDTAVKFLEISLCNTAQHQLRLRPMFQIGAEWAISVSAQISEIASSDDLRPSPMQTAAPR